MVVVASSRGEGVATKRIGPGYSRIECQSDTTTELGRTWSFGLSLGAFITEYEIRNKSD